MPDTPTTRLGLYKSLSDGSELVDYSQDIGQNLDKLDLAVGFQVVTSSTRPSAPYPGKPITESNTSYRTYFSNGTAPASGSWVEIPNSSGTFGGDLVLSGSSAIDIGGAANGGGYGVLGSSATSDVLYSKVSGDSVGRFYVSADGAHQWGSGAATRDTNLYRSAANTLKTDDSLIVDVDLTVNGNINTADNLNMGAWTTYTPTWSTTTAAHAPSYGNATVDARYARIGRTILFYIDITFGNTTNFGSGATTGDNWTFTLPVTARATDLPVGNVAMYVATSKAAYGLATTNTTSNFIINTGSGNVNNDAVNSGIADSVSPTTWASGNRLVVMGQYEAAS